MLLLPMIKARYNKYSDHRTAQADTLVRVIDPSFGSSMSALSEVLAVRKVLEDEKELWRGGQGMSSEVLPLRNSKRIMIVLISHQAYLTRQTNTSTSRRLSVSSKLNPNHGKSLPSPSPSPSPFSSSFPSPVPAPQRKTDESP